MEKVPLVAIENISVSYGDTRVLDGVSTRVDPLEIRVILGGSGCGKTTLLKTIIGLIRPAGGSIRLFGKEPSEPDSTETMEVLKRIGVLFQNGALLGSLTVAENISLPLELHTDYPPELIEEIVRIKLGQVEMGHAGDRFPNQLSGGMRKRAALARAIVMDPELLFCDEPSAGLDPITAKGLDDLLLRLRDRLGITIMVVTHETGSIKAIADSVTFLEKGKVAFDGPLKEALAISTGPVRDFFERRVQEDRAGNLSAVDQFFLEKQL